MGPRFCKRGNYRARVFFQKPSSGLQWGHAFVSVETGSLSESTLRAQRFNGATLL